MNRAEQSTHIRKRGSSSQDTPAFGVATQSDPFTHGQPKKRRVEQATRDQLKFLDVLYNKWAKKEKTDGFTTLPAAVLEAHDLPPRQLNEPITQVLNRLTKDAASKLIGKARKGP
ncbi:hypothetical protein CLV71_104281 [Actinophytocola oryzae]|uniref:Uncharacterized protein n=1 Tax=Actinophytocola oryzae TaxID=502181 RepID=A0A4R7VUZ1_9PSEU|nr:hypothetical protein CLV71_104281 [Actinophytocola oryzae]